MPIDGRYNILFIALNTHFALLFVYSSLFLMHLAWGIKKVLGTVTEKGISPKLLSVHFCRPFEICWKVDFSIVFFYWEWVELLKDSGLKSTWLVWGDSDFCLFAATYHKIDDRPNDGLTYEFSHWRQFQSFWLFISLSHSNRTLESSIHIRCDFRGV